jgi:hypothetical protein
MSRPITTHFHKPVSASPETTYSALVALEPRPQLQRALTALGVDDRVISSHRIQIAPRRCAGYALVWRLAGGTRAELTWMASVKSDGDSGSLLSIAVRAEAGDERSHEQLLAAWPVLGRLSDLHARRTLAAVAELADQYAEDAEAFDAPATLRAVV